MKEKPWLLTVLYGLCAVLWTALTILNFAKHPDSANDTIAIMDLFCALLWTAGFVIQLVKLRRANRK